ncbi:phosphotransferase [Dactylosporangium siamense]|uniref:Aminoglycoside phosphotransferase domain-containing protein n=1 Tax=Dactylosporangium siamense TaxID=685454 RepID=A0A919PWZ0_9ACTN|nr:phosphotransferase [Dactylosporangium siamense]GIG51829.1 hypothetical protein Dsi01nite_098700 [Dactylosporangium siamense]
MRPTWQDLPAEVRRAVEEVIGGPVARAESCPGGFSPGFASRLTRTDGERRFVKAIDAGTWPHEVDAYRTEAEVGAALPDSVPAPRWQGGYDDGRWCVLTFEDVDGAAPGPTPTDIRRVVEAIANLAIPSPIRLPAEHPRLGGWADLATDPTRVAGLRRLAPWAADDLPCLIELERDGIEAARGNALVHGDLYPHNILLTAARVVFVDWPHARLGSPVIDLVAFLSSVAADGVDPEPYVPTGGAVISSVAADGVDPEPYVPTGGAVTGVLAAHAGFLLAGGLAAGRTPITEAKLRLGRGALAWLETRL